MQTFRDIRKLSDSCLIRRNDKRQTERQSLKKSEVFTIRKKDLCSFSLFLIDAISKHYMITKKT